MFIISIIVCTIKWGGTAFVVGGEWIKLQIFLIIINFYVNSYKMSPERTFCIHTEFDRTSIWRIEKIKFSKNYKSL